MTTTNSKLAIFDDYVNLIENETNKLKLVELLKFVIQIKWEKPIDYEMIKEVVSYNIIEKEHTSTFWR